jgi:tetratricopeptide (TPR) repeat protein
VFDKANKTEELEKTLRQVLEIREKLAEEHPEVPHFQNSIAGTLNNLATALMNRGEWEEARRLLECAIVHEQAALKTNPKNKYYRQFLTTQLNNLTGVQLALGDPNAARQTADDWAHHLLQVQNPERLVPTVVTDIESLINHMDRLRHSPGGPRQEPLLAGKLLCAKALIRKTIELAADDPKQYQLADILSTAPEELRDPDLGLKLARKANELKPEDGMCAQSLGWALYRTGDWGGSMEAIKRQPDTSESGFVLAMAHWQLGEKTEARALFERSNEWLKEYEQRCEEFLKQRVVPHPSVSMLKRLQTEATALLGVTPPTVESVPEPAKEVETPK